MVTRAAFRARVADRALLFDGATGTVLQHRWSGSGHGFEGLNLTAPEIVADAHAAYVRAGVDVIETNTFGANRFRLDEHGLGERVAEVNAAAVAIAREAVAGTDVWVAGSVGPLGVVLAPIGRVVGAEAARCVQRADRCARRVGRRPPGDRDDAVDQRGADRRVGRFASSPPICRSSR